MTAGLGARFVRAWDDIHLYAQLIQETPSLALQGVAIKAELDPLCQPR